MGSALADIAPFATVVLGLLVTTRRIGSLALLGKGAVGWIAAGPVFGLACSAFRAVAPVLGHHGTYPFPWLAAWNNRTQGRWFRRFGRTSRARVGPFSGEPRKLVGHPCDHLMVRLQMVRHGDERAARVIDRRPVPGACDRIKRRRRDPSRCREPVAGPHEAKPEGSGKNRKGQQEKEFEVNDHGQGPLESRLASGQPRIMASMRNCGQGGASAARTVTPLQPRFA